MYYIFCNTNQNIREVKNERFLILTRQNNVQIFSIHCLQKRQMVAVICFTTNNNCVIHSKQDFIKKI